MWKPKCGLSSIVVAVVVLLAGCETTNNVGKAAQQVLDFVIRGVLFALPMDEAELTSMYSKGPSLSITWVDGDSGILHFRTDGKVTLEHRRKTYQGMWRIAGDTLCTRFGDDREERCFRQYRRKPARIVWYDAYTGSRHGFTENVRGLALNR